MKTGLKISAEPDAFFPPVKLSASQFPIIDPPIACLDL
jgi:hypothetical protein